MVHPRDRRPGLVPGARDLPGVRRAGPRRPYRQHRRPGRPDRQRPRPPTIPPLPPPAGCRSSSTAIPGTAPAAPTTTTGPAREEKPHDGTHGTRNCLDAARRHARRQLTAVSTAEARITERRRPTAQKILVTLVDDTDGSEAAETVWFGLDGTHDEMPELSVRSPRSCSPAQAARIPTSSPGCATWTRKASR
jgi:hypothetical protein